MAAHSLNPAVNIAGYLHADQSPPATEGVEVALYRGCIVEAEAKGPLDPSTGRARQRPGLAWFSLPHKYIRTSKRASKRTGARSPYIISLSSTLYMRSRSIFCLFAPLNASHPVWFSETISRISTAAAAAFSVLAYRSGYLSVSSANDCHHYRYVPAWKITLG